MPAGAATCHVLAAHAGGLATGCPEGWDVADLPLRADDGMTVVDALTLAHFHRLGVPVHVWTADEEAEMRAAPHPRGGRHHERPCRTCWRG